MLSLCGSWACLQCDCFSVWSLYIPFNLGSKFSRDQADLTSAKQPWVPWKPLYKSKLLQKYIPIYIRFYFRKFPFCNPRVLRKCSKTLLLCRLEHIYKASRAVTSALAFISSCANPVLYTFAGKSYIRKNGFSFMARLFEGTSLDQNVKKSRHAGKNNTTTTPNSSTSTGNPSFHKIGDQQQNFADKWNVLMCIWFVELD